MTLAPSMLRRRILKMAFAGSSVHIPCAFSMVEITSVLYSKYLAPKALASDSDCNHFVLSKGHGVMAVYAALAELGILAESELENYFSDGSRLKGLADSHVPGIEATTGSLGHGLPVAVGIAKGLQLSGSSRSVFCVVGDGEMNEGTMWEALLFAQHHRLDRLVVIVDANGYQAMGTTDEVLALGKLHEKFTAFGFDALDVDGHDVEALSCGIDQLLSAVNGRPKAIVAKTIKGKGVSFMEGRNDWHYTRLSADTLARALTEVG